ncbi:hypothetical protein [Billgrantia bachuensis]|uniref:Secreted protein n=1 Tax=Billgrantia bachuensis TaxID=2717286 RepID=A0ABX0PNM0_9GAMM|nr:hypothetical protein [Halomonas bachuensis]NIC04195.1 hypothetical protein [Halomonas bachuensis]
MMAPLGKPMVTNTLPLLLRALCGLQADAERYANTNAQGKITQHTADGASQGNTYGNPHQYSSPVHRRAAWPTL